MLQRLNSPRLHHGFTLLEIMVVIVIVGIMATVAMISFGALGRDRDMEDQAERIWAVINQTREECELQGFDVGLRVGTNSYDFLRFDARQQLWLPIVEDDLMSPRELSPGLRFRLRLEGREVVLKDRLAEDDTAKKEQPQSKPATETEVRAGVDAENTLLDDKKEKKKELPPQIMILSSGDVNAFDLGIERDGGDARWRVFSKPDNSVTVEQVLEEI